MAWLTLFNGVVAPLENTSNPNELEARARALPGLKDYEIEVEDEGLQVFPKARKFTTTIYGPGNSDSFADCWVGKGAFNDECNMWPFGPEAKQPTEEEEKACLAAATQVKDLLEAAGVKVGKLNYGPHIVCFD